MKHNHYGARQTQTGRHDVMTSILCLAHYCDLHGPTPLMVTEGIEVPCAQCDHDATDLERPQSSQPATVADSLRKMTLTAARSSSVPASQEEAQTHRAALRQASRLSTATTTAVVETPPPSPHSTRESFTDPPHDKKSSRLRRDSSFRRTYDDYVTKRANPCQNCAMTLPKELEDAMGRERNSPQMTECRSEKILRTRAPHAHCFNVNSSPATSPPSSNPVSSCPSDDEEVSPKETTAKSSLAQLRHMTSTSQSSLSSKSSLSAHTHYMDYTSTHEPLSPNTYSIVRQACLRTLSFETLPRRPEHGITNSSSLASLVSNNAPPYTSPPPALNVPSNPPSAAGGPIFFGDPLAGYTTAYIFRIPDVHARGRKRVYAFLAISTHRERLAMKTFGLVAAKFREFAGWIQEHAEAEAEREREREEENMPVAGMYSAYANSSSALGGMTSPRDSGIGLGLGGGSLGRDSKDRDASSFLTAGSRGGYLQRMGGSMGPGGFAPKARGLAELVGLPNFFVQLHAKFVTLSLELGVVVGS